MGYNKEYYEKNKEKFKEYTYKYRKNHKEHMKELNKKYRKKTKDRNDKKQEVLDKIKEYAEKYKIIGVLAPEENEYMKHILELLEEIE